MNEYFGLLQTLPLFRGIAEPDLERMLLCLDAWNRSYSEGQTILQAGERAERIGILLEGRVQVIREEYSGERTILAELEPGELFAEAFACALGEEKTLPVTVLSIAQSRVLLLDYQRIVSGCSSACPFHSRLIENMLAVMAGKNRMLNRRIGHLSKRSTREKLLSYLAEEAARQGSPEFYIPFDRQELADYLCVERSAMSAVLSRLRTEGILDLEKNCFRLKKNPGNTGSVS